MRARDYGVVGEDEGIVVDASCAVAGAHRFVWGEGIVQARELFVAEGVVDGRHVVVAEVPVCASS